MIQHYPILLLLHDKNVLVVGGGKVATRKVKFLWNYGVRHIRVVAPEITVALGAFATQHKLKIERREFCPEDVDGCGMVFASTNSHEVNHAVIQSAHAHHVPVCAVDDQWGMGNFITPANTWVDDISVSISTGGKACRRSRLMKQWVSDHLPNALSPTFLVLGTDHLHLSLKEREPLHLHGKRYTEVTQILKLLSPIHEFMVLNTCNRVELYAIAQLDPDTREVLQKILGFNTREHGDFYFKEGVEAFAHFSRVTAGLLSQTPGENYITAQVKETLKTALAEHHAHQLLQAVTEQVLHTARQIRTAVSGVLRCTEIEGLVQLYLEAQSSTLHSKNILMIGTGTIGQAVVNTLQNSGAQIYWFYHQNKPEFTATDTLQCFQLNDLKNYLNVADIIITAVDAENPILHPGHAPFFDLNRPCMAIDLSLPRNIDPHVVSLLPLFSLINLDDLKHWYRREACDMDHVLQLARAEIEHEESEFKKFLTSLKNATYEN